MEIKVSKTNQDGFALPYVLVVSLLIVSILLGLFTTAYFYNRFAVRNITKKKTELACYSALQMDLVGINDFNDHIYTVSIDSIIVTVEHKQRGFFFEVTVTSHFNQDSSQAVYTIANPISFPLENALIISRPNLRASVAGKSKIKGNILASSDIFIPGSIFGVEPQEGSFLNGKIIVDNNIKPKLYSEQIIKNIDLKRSELKSAANVIDDDFILDQNSLRLLESCTKMKVNGDLRIRGELNDPRMINRKIFVYGKTIFEGSSLIRLNLDIYSDSAVYINKAHLENIFISAEGNIYISNQSLLKGVQLFSRNNISVENSTMLYPSVACIYSENSRPEEQNTRLEEQKSTLNITNSRINGTLMLLCQSTGMENNRSLIKTDRSSIIQGLIYSENNVESHAQVKGIIYTYNFWYYKDPTEYINWLVGVNIERDGLNPYFLLPAGFSNKNNFEILSERWIY